MLAEEVLAMYGLYERVAAVTGGRYKELAKESIKDIVILFLEDFH